MRKQDQRPAEFRGHLYIFVDKHPAVSVEPEQSAAAFDDIFGRLEPGQMRWYLSGWAVGKNAQGRYCSRTSTTKARRFGTFSEAMDYARRKRWTHPKESFYLVYEVDGQKAIVTSLEQIQRMDGGPPEASPGTALAAEPILERMAERVDRIVATNAMALYRMLQHEGEAAARARFSTATYERLRGVLLEAGLADKNAGMVTSTTEPDAGASWLNLPTAG